MRDPLLLLLDEPTAHLDDARSESLFEIFEELAAEGRALLVSTHDPRFANARGVSKVLDLVDGRLSGNRVQDSPPSARVEPLA
jgi:putative ABC transport system ATP-binding protein